MKNNRTKAYNTHKIGQCFSSINTVEKYWNGWVIDVEAIKKEIGDNPADYPGSNNASK